MTGLLAMVGGAAVASGQVNLPEGEGRELVMRVCTTCHGVDHVMRFRLSPQKWKKEVDDMAERGAEATDEQFAQITAYLAKNFGPEKKAEAAARVNVNTAAASDLMVALGISEHDAVAIVEYRKKNGNLKGLADLKKVPDIDSAKIEAAKDRLDF
jgi:competence ComEA-like helix-hairpin-helix protein